MRRPFARRRRLLFSPMLSLVLTGMVWSLPSAAADGDPGGNPHPAPTHGHAIPADRRVAAFSGSGYRLDYDLAAGTADVAFGGSARIRGMYSQVRTDRTITTRDYAERSCSVVRIHDRFGAGSRITVTHRGRGLPAMKQMFYVYDHCGYFLTEAVFESLHGVTSNLMAPVVVTGTGAVDLGTGGSNRMILMPYDNDSWDDLLTDGSVNGEGTSYEVTAMYDNQSRSGFVFGSVTHEFWKTGISFQGSGNRLDTLRIFGGANSERDTRDLCPHGARVGTVIHSPLIFLGRFADWRRGHELRAREGVGEDLRPYYRPVLASP